MKRISSLKLAALCASVSLLLPLLWSCSGGADGVSDYKDTATYTPQSDTLSLLLGQVNGQGLLCDIQKRIDSGATFDKEQFLKGLAMVLAKRQPRDYLGGLGYGLDISYDLNNFEDSGFTLNRDMIIEKAEKAVDTVKTVDIAKTQEMGQQYMALTEKMLNAGSKKAPKALVDSVAQAYSTLIATTISQNFADYTRHEGKKVDLPAFFTGVRAITEKKHSVDFLAGVNAGLTIYQQIVRLETLGVNVRFDIVLKTIEDIFKNGKADEEQLKVYDTKIQEFVDRVGKQAFAAQEKARAESDEAVQNVKTAEALIAKLKKENPGIKTSETGLNYLVSNPGSGVKPSDNDTVVVSYTGYHLDDKEFDKGESVAFSLNAVVPGFREGIKMLGEGGEAQLWIPGELAYGAFGSPQGGIGPMETLKFDVKVEKIKRAK